MLEEALGTDTIGHSALGMSLLTIAMLDIVDIVDETCCC